jgi:hypothetical protein
MSYAETHIGFYVILISGSTVLVRTLAASHRRFRNLNKILGRIPLGEWSARRKGLYPHRNTKTNIHASSGIRTHDPSNQAVKTYALDRARGHGDRRWFSCIVRYHAFLAWCAQNEHICLSMSVRPSPRFTRKLLDVFWWNLAWTLWRRLLQIRTFLFPTIGSTNMADAQTCKVSQPLALHGVVSWYDVRKQNFEK